MLKPRPAKTKGPLPVTVLSGSLGAGKTSVLNHLHPFDSWEAPDEPT